jgi:outer membrane protein assembly factor BamD (BamD/ComL family)
MTIKFWLASVLFLVCLSCAPAVYAQGGVKTGPDPSTIRDPDLEKDSLHNLEVARNYFRLKKAYVAALNRCEEIIAGNPNFAKIEEVLYMAGRSSLSLSQNKGKQGADKYVSFEGGVKRTLTAEELRKKARDYLTRLIDEYPDGPYAKEAKDALAEIEAPKPASN